MLAACAAEVPVPLANVVVEPPRPAHISAGLHGRVADVTANAGLVGATLLVSNRTQTWSAIVDDLHGDYEIEGVVPGHYKVELFFGDLREERAVDVTGVTRLDVLFVETGRRHLSGCEVVDDLRPLR
jgi:hypothetical protein